MGRKVGAAVPLSMKEKLGPHLTQCGLAEAYLCTKWYLDPSSILATTDIWPQQTWAEKWGTAVPVFGV